MSRDREALFSAIARLQQRRKNYSKRGDEFLTLVADDAITLALSPNRKANEYLALNSFRNARYLVSRRKRLHLPLPGIEEECIGNEVQTLYVDTSIERADFFVERVDFQTFLEAIAENIHPQGKQVLEAMLAREPISTTASALGCSDRTVKSIRSLIRRKVKLILSNR